MVVLIRVVRGICGFVFVLQLIGIVPAISWLFEPGRISGHMMALLLIKIVTLVVSGGLFVGLRHVINSIHERKNGKPHPVLGIRIWAL